MSMTITFRCRFKRACQEMVEHNHGINLQLTLLQMHAMNKWLCSDIKTSLLHEVCVLCVMRCLFFASLSLSLSLSCFFSFSLSLFVCLLFYLWIAAVNAPYPSCMPSNWTVICPFHCIHTLHRHEEESIEPCTCVHGHVCAVFYVYTPLNINR